MLKKLKKYLNILNFFSKKKETLLSDKIDESEKIVRSIFSPINLNKKGDKLNPNTFRPPAGIDEISVNRLSFTTENFCKQHSKKIQSPDFDRNYFGLALLYANEIFECNCNIEYSPDIDNITHSNIKIGYIPVKGEQLPAEFQKKVKDLTEKARLYKDLSPDSLNWEGETLN